jgi:hypothetical protein
MSQIPYPYGVDSLSRLLGRRSKIKLPLFKLFCAMFQMFLQQHLATFPARPVTSFLNSVWKYAQLQARGLTKFVRLVTVQKFRGK